jgi:hypothetical protein
MAECTAGIGMGRDGTADTGMAMDLDGMAATDLDGTAAIDPECMGIDVVRTGAGSLGFRKATNRK